MDAQRAGAINMSHVRGRGGEREKMGRFYRNEETGETLDEMHYELLPVEEKEKYAYLGRHRDGWKAREAEPLKYEGDRVRVGQRVVGIFDTKGGYFMSRERVKMYGTVVYEDRNHFKVEFDGGMEWDYTYYSDMGRIVYPR